MMSEFNASTLRATVLKMAYAGSTVHIGCAFSIIEILAVLYRNHLRYPDNDPESAQRDYMVLSKGHGVMAQYACLYEKGWLPKSDLENYFSDGSRLKGLSDAHITGCEVTSGSLGHGLSVGTGMALAAKLNKSDQYCYAVVGDGEMNEGPMWESMLFAKHWALDNLIVIVDENGFQAMGTTADVMQLGNLQTKFEAFGFDAVTVDGHDEAALDQALIQLKANKNGAPKAIVAKTVKGKGVSFMEHQNIWHYTRLNEDTFGASMAELEQAQ
ncbi:transketolase [Janthinobacterium sp. PSPC1-1]|uniref:transketolase n=1 Tax=Janthinobacterium sp. PSPC1-1 TaxID=2804581 RepID=UPI003CE887AB